MVEKPSPFFVYFQLIFVIFDRFTTREIYNKLMYSYTVHITAPPCTNEIHVYSAWNAVFHVIDTVFVDDNSSIVVVVVVVATEDQ